MRVKFFLFISFFIAIFLTILTVIGFSRSVFVTPMQAALYSPFEVQLTSTRYYNIPYVEVKVTGIFISPTGKELRLDGFWDGGQIWRVRFAPNEVGVWTFRTESDDPELLTAGQFNALPTTRQGFVRVSKSRPYQFESSDGTPFLLMGDTNWDAMSSGVGFEARFKPYIDLRRSQNFNAYHTIVVNNRLDYQSNEGGMPYVMFDPETRDYNRLNPDYFKWVDRRVAYADSMGMVSILFFTWAHEIAKMSTTDYQRLALYIVSRYAAYNVFWILAGDYQAYYYQPPVYRQVGNAVALADPYHHPISIHPSDGHVNTEFAKDAWLSYMMHQLRDAGEFLADSIRFDHIYSKPVVNGEYGYHVPESVHPYHGIRQDANFTRTGGWSIFAAGGYFVTGFEHTYLDPNGYYPYDPGFDTPPLFWDLNDAADSEAARQFSVLFRFFRDYTNWTDLESHPELVLDGQTALLANPGVEYVAYNVRGGRMRLRLPAAQQFSLSWFNPVTGILDLPSIFESADETNLITPSDTLDAVALLQPATPLSSTPAGEVEDLRSEQLSVHQVRFRWTTPEPADSRIDVQDPDGTWRRFIAADANTQHELVVDGILPAIKYKVTVSSQTSSGKIWKTLTECLLTTTVVLDQFIEAETMPTKTVGHAEPPGWNLDAEGFLAMPINFPQTGAYRFEIIGRGEYRSKAWPQLALSIDNGSAGTLTINSAVFRLFQHERHIPAGTRTLALAFTNPGDGRQLIIDQLHVQFIDKSAAPPPLIAGITVTNLTIASATIIWKTDTPTETQIEYGTSSNYGTFTPVTFCRDTAHVVTLSGLTQNTTYHFRVLARDAAGKLARSHDTTFTTLSAVERLDKISGDNQMGKPQKLLAAPIVIKVLDATGAGMSNIKVAFRVISGGGRLIIANACDSTACVITTEADGSAAAGWELGKTEAQIVEASVLERPDLVVRFTAQVDLTSVPSEDHKALPAAFALHHHPNPFRETAQFEIALPAPGHISLKIFDVQGREVATLIDGAKTAGWFWVNWNGRDQSSREIAAGIYFVVLRYETKASSGAAQIFTEKRQVVYLK